MNKYIKYIFLLSIAFSSCISRPDYVLDEDAMVTLLTDVHRSEGLLELQQNNQAFSGNESYKQSVMASVLVKNGVTRAQYDSSLVWYGQNLKYLVRVYSKVQKNINDEIEYWSNYNSGNKSSFGVSEAGDSVQLWTIDRDAVLSEERLLAMKFWEIPTDSNYVNSDSIVWHFSAPYIPASHFLVATLSMTYKGEQPYHAISKTVVLRNDSVVDISCVSDSVRLFDSLVASVSLLKDSINVPDDVAIIDSLSLIRIHK